MTLPLAPRSWSWCLGALCAGALLLSGPARGDDDEEDPVEEPPSVAATLELLGQDRERVALELLEARPAQLVLTEARATLARVDTSVPAARVLGAALWLSSHVDREECRQLQRAVRGYLSDPLEPTLHASLLESLGALGEFGYLEQRLRRGPVTDAGPAARGLCRSAHPAALPALLATIGQLEESAEEDARRTAELAAAYPDAPPPPGAGQDAARLAAALEALRWFAARPGGERLARAVRDAPSPSLPVLEALLEARERATRQATGEVGKALLLHEAPPYRALGVRLLVVSRDPETRDLVGDALRDDAPQVRAAAALAVVDLQARREIPRLIGLLEDGESEVRVAAHKALVRFAQREIPGRRLDWEQWWEREQAARQVE